MRLIDADKVIDTINKMYQVSDGWDKETYRTLLLASIGVAIEEERIDAIPISWVEKWVRNDRTADPDTFIDMISDWRKEND